MTDADRAARDELFARMNFSPNAYADAWLIRRLLTEVEAERDEAKDDYLRVHNDKITLLMETAALKADRDRALRVVEAAQEWRNARRAAMREANEGLSPIPSVDRLSRAEHALNDALAAYDAGREGGE